VPTCAYQGYLDRPPAADLHSGIVPVEISGSCVRETERQCSHAVSGGSQRQPWRVVPALLLLFSSLVLLRLRFPDTLESGQSALCVSITGRQLKSGVQLFLRLVKITDPTVEQPQILVQMGAFRTRPTKVNCLVHLLHRLGPILRVGGFQSEVAQFSCTVRDQLLSL